MATGVTTSEVIESFELDSNHDVSFVVGAQAPQAPNTLGKPLVKIYNIHVNSHNVKQASPVWRAMISGGTWEESSLDIISLPKDNADAMLLILSIAHLRFEHVPDNITQEQLYQVAVLCDKYDCIGLVRPWARTWTDAMRYCPSIYKRGSLIIAWTFGLETRLQDEMLRIMKDSNISNEQELVSNFHDDFHLEIVPPVLSNRILEMRAIVLGTIHKEAAALISAYTPCMPHKKTICKAKKSSKLCDYALLGSLTSGLMLNISMESGLRLGRCLRTISSSLASLQLLQPTVPEGAGDDGKNLHRPCKLQMQEIINTTKQRICASWKGIVTKEMKEDLRKQRSRSGCL